MRRNVLVALTLMMALVGCAPIAGASAFWTAGLGAFLILIASVVWAGAPTEPKPCDGWTHESCQQGRIDVRCIPNGKKINFAHQVYINCGHGQCVMGDDPAKCPPRTPAIAW